MARDYAHNGRVYRAVITKTYTDGRTSQHSYGPYDTAAPAKGMITRALCEAERSHGQYRNPSSAHTAVGRLQSAEVVWADVQ